MNFQILPQEVLMSEPGELTELGRSYVPPQVLLDSLCVVCSSASQWGDPAEAENLAMEILIVTHHPSIGMRGNFSSAFIRDSIEMLNLYLTSCPLLFFFFSSRSSPWPLACSASLHEHKSWRIYRKESRIYSATSARGQRRQPGLKTTHLYVPHLHFCCFGLFPWFVKWITILWPQNLKKKWIAESLKASCGLVPVDIL